MYDVDLSLRESLRMLLQVMLFSEEEERLWKDLIDHLSEEQVQELWDLLSKERGECDDSIFESLSNYLQYCSKINGRREDFLKSISDDAVLKPFVDSLLKTSPKFTEEEINAIFEDDEKIAEFLATLTTLEIEQLKENLKDMAMTDDEQKTLQKLLDQVQEEMFTSEKESAAALELLAVSISMAIGLHGQLQKLQRIQAEISS